METSIQITNIEYTVKVGTDTWKFHNWSNGISIPWANWDKRLRFENSRLWRVKSFHKALSMFIDEVEQSEVTHPSLLSPVSQDVWIEN